MKGMNTMSEKKENALVKGFRGIKSELKKVTWPTFKQVAKNTWTVILSVIIVGLFIFVLDLAFGAILQYFIKK